MPDDTKTNGWNEWSRHVLIELERLNKKVEDMDKHQAELKLENEVLKTKLNLRSAAWGAIAAIFPVAIGLLILFIKLNASG